MFWNHDAGKYNYQQLHKEIKWTFGKVSANVLEWYLRRLATEIFSKTLSTFIIVFHYIACIEEQLYWSQSWKFLQI